MPCGEVSASLHGEEITFVKFPIIVRKNSVYLINGGLIPAATFQMASGEHSAQIKTLSVLMIVAVGFHSGSECR